MQSRPLLLVCAAVSLAWGGASDATYYLQGATEYVTEGRLAATETVTSNTTTARDAQLTGILVPHASIEYKVVKQFKGEFGVPGHNPVTFRLKRTNVSTFVDTQFTNMFTLMYDTTCDICPNNVRLAGSDFDYYFPIATDTSQGLIRFDSTKYVIGRKGPSTKFTSWFGVALVRDSVKQTAAWGIRIGGSYAPDYDSAQLSAALYAVVRDPAKTYDGTNLIGRYTVQMLKLTYDTTTAAVAWRPQAQRGAAANMLREAGTVRVFDLNGRAVSGVARVAGTMVSGVAGVYLVEGATRAGVVRAPAVVVR